MQTATLDEFVSRVRAGSDILSVASRYVSFVRKGGRYWACCPFHSEKTPSFTVDPIKGFFHCFGCGAGGNVFNLIAQIENVSYFDAIKLQANRLGIPLPSNRQRTPQELERERRQKALYNVNELARNFFHNCLTQTSYGEIGRKYLQSRGITEQIIEDFGLGFAPNSWDKLSSAFAKRGIDDNQLLAAGLVSERKRGSGVYDRFRNRIMIPIVDITGHVLAFGGRILETPSDAKIHVVGAEPIDAPKYLNSPETIIFNKRRVLFGLDRAASSITREGFVIVVEGYMDAISLVSAGVKNVVATLGTAFTAEHAKILNRYSKRIVFCYDSDSAGQNATMRALPIIASAGAQASVIIIPDGKDPDEFVRKHGRDEFWNLALNAVSMIDYRIKYVLEHGDQKTLDGRIGALREILSSIAKMHDTALRNEYSRKLSTLLGLDLNTVNDEWKKYSSAREVVVPSGKVVKINTVRAESKNDSVWRARRTIIKTGWYASDLLQHALGVIPKENFPPVHQEIIKYLEKCLDEERHADDISAAEVLSAEALTELSECLAYSSTELTGTDIQAYMDSLVVLKSDVLSQRYQTLARELEQCTRGSPEFLSKLTEAQNIKRELDRKHF